MTDPSPPVTEPSSAPVAHSPSVPESWSAVLLIILIGVATWLRMVCSAGELWLDEIWTWDISSKLTWVGGLFSQLREENNHYLNTLIIWGLRDQSLNAGFWFRFPAVICGVGTVVLSWRLGRTYRSEGLRMCAIAAGLTTTSYLMVHYSSEARGYAYAVFFAAWAFDQLWRLEQAQLHPPKTLSETRSMQVARVLWPLANCGGFLSQPIFLTCFGAMVVWVYLRTSREGLPQKTWQRIRELFFIPGAFFVLLYVIDLRHAVNGGGDQYPLWRVVLETLSLVGGGPFAGWGAAIVAGLVAGTFLHGLRVMHQEQDDRWIFHLLVVVVMPLGLLVVLRRAEVYPRYFLIAVFFLLQTVAVSLTDLLRRGSTAWGVAILGLAALMWGNGQHIGQLAHWGRGGYLPILAAMNQQESSNVIQIRSDHDFRHPLMLKYYLPLADLHEKQWEYFEREQVPTSGTTWLLTHSLAPSWQPPLRRTVSGVRYELRHHQPYAGLSGWGLALYRRPPESSQGLLDGVFPPSSGE